AWCYNYSKEELSQNIDKTLRFYNSEVDRFRKSLTDISVDNFIDFDAKKISWNRGLKSDLVKGKKYHFDKEKIRVCLYRPF
ncbi:hypothetical protein OFN23_34200, partial [Escherichia coli]|nr:hypothetical protein [Escherichia coli]